MSEPYVWPVTHIGSRYIYVKRKCRCQECTKANAIYKRNKANSHRTYAASKASETGLTCLQSSGENFTCGIPNTYDWYGCRGQACLKAIRKEQQEHRFLKLIDARALEDANA